MLIRTPALAIALGLAFAGPACSQNAAPDESVAATPVSGEESSGFNLRMPGEEGASTYDGFNLSIPGENDGGFMLPDDAVSNNALSGLPEFEAPAEEAPAAPSEDDVIRLQP